MAMIPWWGAGLIVIALSVVMTALGIALAHAAMRRQDEEGK